MFDQDIVDLVRTENDPQEEEEEESVDEQAPCATAIKKNFRVFGNVRPTESILEMK